MTLTEQIEILKEARAGLHMWHMDTSGVDKMLAQHGVDVSSLPNHPPLPPVLEITSEMSNQQAI